MTRRICADCPIKVWTMAERDERGMVWCLKRKKLVPADREMPDRCWKLRREARS
jgi:hypothetical protein